MTQDSNSRSTHLITEQMLRGIQECTSCHAVCLHTMTVVLFTAQLAKDDALIRSLQDCADICQTSADFMLRGSPLHGLTCEACARICETCAASCGKYPEDENLRACADSCEKCAASCQAVAAAAPDWRDQISGT